MQINIAQLFRELAMVGSGAPDTEVEAFSGRFDETKDGKQIYSAVIKIATKYVKAISQNSLYNCVSFKIKYEGK